MNFRSSFQVARIWGIPVRIHLSLIVLLLLVGFSVWRAYGALFMRDVLILQLSAFFSIALHELGHSFVAIRKGCRVREITLLFIGGAAQMERIPRRPADEIQMAMAGPLVSVLLAVAGYYGGLSLYRHGWERAGGLVHIVGWVNGGLALFNLIPAFPMDGGRVFRAAMTPRLGRLRATAIAARLGRVLAVGLGLTGFLIRHETPQGWVLVAAAFFVYTIAGKEYRMVQIEEAARQREFWLWTPADGAGPEPCDDDRVIVGPPPYERGPGSESPLRPTRRRSWIHLFSDR